MLLYENHCQNCHDCRLHLRGDRRRAADLAAVRRDVRRWAAELKVTWGAEEIDDVVTYLNRTYYKYPPVR
jgi:mono/diheme cytochrome c family protein